jgi:hypothetical protein
MHLIFRVSLRWWIRLSDIWSFKPIIKRHLQALSPLLLLRQLKPLNRRLASDSAFSEIFRSNIGLFTSGWTGQLGTCTIFFLFSALFLWRTFLDNALDFLATQRSARHDARYEFRTFQYEAFQKEVS